MRPAAVYQDNISFHRNIKVSEFDGHQGARMKNRDAHLPHHGNNEETQLISIKTGFQKVL